MCMIFFNNLQHTNDGFNINNFVKFADGHTHLASGSKLRGCQMSPIEISILIESSGFGMSYQLSATRKTCLE